MLKIVLWVLLILTVFVVIGMVTDKKEKHSIKGVLIASVIGLVLIFFIFHKSQPSDTSAKDSSSKATSVKSSSSSSVVPKIDNDLLNTLNSSLSSGDTNKFINTFINLDIRKQSDYYQKFRTNTDIKIKGTAFYKNSAGSRLYLYVNEDDKPLVALDREQSYDGLISQGQAHNVFILKADRGTFSDVQLMTTVVATGTLGTINAYQKDKMDNPFDLNDAKIIK